MRSNKLVVQMNTPLNVHTLQHLVDLGYLVAALRQGAVLEAVGLVEQQTAFSCSASLNMAAMFCSVSPTTCHQVAGLR